VRDELETRYDRIGGEAMLAELAEVDPDYASERHPNDKRRIVRALEVFRLSGKPYSSFHTTDGKRRSDYRTLLLGIRWDKEELHKRINARARAMFADGLIDEVRDLRDRLSQEARQAVGYKEVLELLDGSCDEEDARYRVQRNSRMLAKHQNTWYKRFRDLTWLDGAATDLSAQALKRARDFLAQEG
jgi:tRNA dimethylallyltransferase